MPTHYDGTEREKLALDTYIKLDRAADAVNRRVNGHLQETGLTVSQFGVLEAIYHLGPMSVGQIAAKVLCSSANLTMVIDNLVKRGLASRERRPDDRRAVIVSLTDDGRKLIAGLMPAHVAGVVTTFGILSPEEQATLSALCRKLGIGPEDA